MSLVINSNISSLNAQNNLTKSGNALAQATERLSSGLKINSAADNAAGYAISQKYTTQIGALGQASSNASDAINLAQTAGSALQQVTSNLQAIRDLAAQAANGTYTTAERGTIDKEVQQRLAEVSRIANQTTFNGKKVLDGSLATQTFQIGANVGQTISVNLDTGVRANQLGNIATTSSGDISGDFASPAGLNLKAGDLTVGGTNVAAGNYSSAGALATAINTAAASSGYTGDTFATASGGEISFQNSSNAAIALGGSNNPLGVTTVAAATGGTTSPGTATATAANITSGITADKNAITLASGDFTIGGTDVTGTFQNAGDLATAINSLSAGLATDNGDGTLTLNNTTGSSIAVAGGVATDLGLNGTLVASTGTATSSDVPTEVSAKSNAVKLSTGKLTINGTDITGTFSDAASLANAISNVGITNFTATASGGAVNFSNSGSTAVTFGGTFASGLGLPTSVAAQSTSAVVDGSATSTGVSTAVAAPASSALTLAAGDLNIDGTDITGKFATVQDLTDQINAANVGVNAAVSGDGKGFNLYSAKDITTSVSTTGALSNSTLASATPVTASAAASASNSLQGADVKSVDDANALISRIDVALSTTSDFAAQLGAVQNRFQSTISTLSSQNTNLTSSQSTIQDADFAAETAALSKAQVLQQAGISVLAKANSQPQQVLRLLQ